MRLDRPSLIAALPVFFVTCTAFTRLTMLAARITLAGSAAFATLATVAASTRSAALATVTTLAGSAAFATLATVAASTGSAALATVTTLATSTRSAAWTTVITLAMVTIWTTHTTFAFAADLRAIGDVVSIPSYRMEAHLQVGDDPPLQGVDVRGIYVKEREEYQIEVTVAEGDRSPVRLEVRRVEGTLYFSSGAAWGVVEKFHLEDVIGLTPEHLLGIGDALEEVGIETRNGREVVHLRGDHEDLPRERSDSRSIDFSRVDSGAVDLWVDIGERFIVRMEIEGRVKERGQTLPFSVVFDYSAFGQEFQIEKPREDEVIRSEPPVSVGQEEVTSALGFSFPIPEGAHADIYGATVAILTAMPLDAARAYANGAMEGAGFRRVAETERAPGEFFSDYEKDGRSLGVLVFQVSESGASIQVNALK